MLLLIISNKIIYKIVMMITNTITIIIIDKKYKIYN